MPNFFLYAANLHVGGAVQVAASVIDELAGRPDEAAQLSLLVSSQVDANLRSIGVETGRFRAYRVADHAGTRLVFKKMDTLAEGADAILVLFGPFYRLRCPIPTVVGFAQPWIIYPHNEMYASQSRLSRCATRIKYALQALFFRQADLLVVELEHVKRGLALVGIGAPGQVEVVRNCLSALYRQPQRWQAAPALAPDARFKLGFVGRNYPHKNTAIFPEVRRLLECKHGLAVSIYVTFSEEEWTACTPAFREQVINVGVLNVAQCPSFYQQMDGVIFPSLLECFSATPLEAMAMKRPLFASDRPFNRDVCGALAWYFDPLDPASAAACIAAYLGAGSLAAERVEAAYRHVLELPGPDLRAQRYMDCLRRAVAA